MTTHSDTTDTTARLVLKNSRTLAMFALLTVGLCVLTYLATRHQINANQTNMKIAALAAVAPDAAGYLDPTQDWIQIKHPKLGYRDFAKVYVIRARTPEASWILPVHAPDGYGGSIHLYMGIDNTGRILGVRVIPPHSETPGLGDKIETKRSDWIKGFNQLSLENTQARDWAVKKDGGQFDAFTGASITPRAVINAVYRGLVFYKDHQTVLQSTPLSSQRVIDP